MQMINSTQGKVALVDDEDFELLSRSKWCFSGKYARRSTCFLGKQKVIWMHRVINNTPVGFETDHIDHNKLNNQRNNLRSVTSTENKYNKGKISCLKGKPPTSRFKGVHWDKGRKKWQASITICGTFVSLGRYDSEEVAATIYDKRLLQFNREFAVLNFPDIKDGFVDAVKAGVKAIVPIP